MLLLHNTAANFIPDDHVHKTTTRGYNCLRVERRKIIPADKQLGRRKGNKTAQNIKLRCRRGMSMVVPSLNIDVGYFQLVALVIPVVVDDTPLLSAVIPLLTLPTSALTSVAMASIMESTMDSVVPAKNRAEI